MHTAGEMREKDGTNARRAWSLCCAAMGALCAVVVGPSSILAYDTFLTES